MRKVCIVLVALAVILSLSCVSTMAQEVKKEYSLIAEIERQREEIRGLREEIRFLREGLLQLLANQIERQWNEMGALREMQQHQSNFMQEMLNREQEVRLEQMMRGRERERKDDDEDNMEMMLRRVQEEVKRNPGDPELRVHLGHLYWRTENVEGAYRQFKAALEIAPDFGEAFESLEKLRMEFPDVSRIPVERPLKDSAGEVISANKEEIRLQIFERDDVVTFKVPFVQNEEGKWVLNEDFAHFAGSLRPGMRIKILWQEMEDRRIIRKVERLEDE